jgi:hypothetical protein
MEILRLRPCGWRCRRLFRSVSLRTFACATAENSPPNPNEPSAAAAELSRSGPYRSSHNSPPQTHTPFTLARKPGDINDESAKQCPFNTRHMSLLAGPSSAPALHSAAPLRHREEPQRRRRIGLDRTPARTHAGATVRPPPLQSPRPCAVCRSSPGPPPSLRRERTRPMRGPPICRVARGRPKETTPKTKLKEQK